VHASHEALTFHSPVTYPSLTLAHPAREVQMFKKRHGVGEGGSELGTDLVLPRRIFHSLAGLFAGETMQQGNFDGDIGYMEETVC
jgi:hypothetical protein